MRGELEVVASLLTNSAMVRRKEEEEGGFPHWGGGEMAISAFFRRCLETRGEGREE